jgi:putative membrane protein
MRISAVLIGAVLAGGLTLAVAAPAYAGTSVDATGDAATASVHRPRPVSEQDATFLVAAHQSNLAEIAGGHVALAKSHNRLVRSIARQLIVDHLRLDAQVRAIACRHRVRLPDRPSAEQRRQLAIVAAKSGTAFDLAWLKLQEAGHLKTLTLIDQELRAGRAADVKAAAAGARPVVKHHLEMVREALARYPGDKS